jgi:hypothetical protein
MSAKELALFIGGPADGARREVFLGQSHERVATMTTSSVLLRDFDLGRCSAVDAIPMARATYERRVLSTPEGKHFVFVPSGMSDADMLLRLLDGYRKQGS